MTFLKKIVYIGKVVHEKIQLGDSRKKSSLERNCKGVIGKTGDPGPCSVINAKRGERVRRN